MKTAIFRRESGSGTDSYGFRGIRETILRLIKVQILSASLILLLLGRPISEAQANLITNGGFTADLSPWITSGTVEHRLSTDNINDVRQGNDAFDGFFTSGFALLGDDVAYGEGQPDSGTHTLSQVFTVVVPGNYAISFITAFEGALDTTSDTFSASLDLTSLFSQTSSGFPTCGPDNSPGCAHSPLTQNPFSTLMFLGAGLHTLTFTLLETLPPGSQDVDGNTFAGIDNVSITAETAGVPEPNALILVGAGLVAIAIRFKRYA